MEQNENLPGAVPLSADDDAAAGCSDQHTNPRTAVHIGMPKAASTTLQNFLGAACDECSFRYIGPSGLPYNRWLQQVIGGEPVDDLPDYHGTTIISHEGLGILKAHNGVEIAEVLKQSLGTTTRILVVLREQREWLLSRFNQDRKGEMITHRTRWYAFAEWLEGALHDELGGYAPLYKPVPRVDYGGLVESYLTRFPCDQLCVLLYEQLRESPQEFWDTVLSFLGVSCSDAALALLSERTNSRVPESCVALHRYLGAVLPNRYARKAAALLVRPLQSLSSGPTQTEDCFQHIPEWVLDHIRTSNRRLEALLPAMDFAAYGYLV